MKKLVTMFIDSAKEFTKLKSLVTAAFLVAVHTVLALFVSIQVTDSLRISVSFAANLVIGALFGPVMGFVCGGLGDIIQFIIKPTGAFNPGLTLSAALAGMIYGLFFYHKFPAIKPKQEEAVTLNKFHLLAGMMTSIITFCLVFVLPFFTLTDENGTKLFTEAHIPVIISAKLNGIACTTPFVIAIILIAGSIALMLFAIFKKYILSFITSIIMIFICILAVYTDRSFLTVHIGFVITMILWLIYAISSFYAISKLHSLDTSFLLRCVIALAVDVFVVNIILSTYWLSLLIGTDFWVLVIPRTIKNLVQLPINIIIAYYVLYFVKKTGVSQGSN